MKREVSHHASIKLSADKIIYFDPFKIEDYENDADIIFITHSHYDHFDIDSIEKIKNGNTIVVAPKTMEEEIKSININNYILLEPNEKTTIFAISLLLYLFSSAFFIVQIKFSV